MLAGAVQAAPASIPKPLVLSGPPSVPVEGGPEKLLTECNYTATHFICGRKAGCWLLVIPVALTAVLAILIAILIGILFLTLVLHLFQTHILLTLVQMRPSRTQALVLTSRIQHLSCVAKIPG